MTGFEIDPDALQKAITKLEDASDRLQDIAQNAGTMLPAELDAGDQTSQQAKTKFGELMHGEVSMATSASDALTKVQEKIDAYKQTLEEYRRSEDAATMDAGNIERQQ